MPLHILRHIQAHQRLLVAEHRVAQRAAQLRFAHARGTEKEKRADGPLRIAQSRAGAAQRAGDLPHRLILPHHARVERVLQPQQPLALILCQARDGHARPGGDHRGHVLLADGPLLFPLRAAQRLAFLLRLLAAAVLHIAQHGRPLIVLLRDCGRAVALRLGSLGLHRPQLR